MRSDVIAICDCDCGCEPDWVDPDDPWHDDPRCACRGLGCPCVTEETSD